MAVTPKGALKFTEITSCLVSLCLPSESKTKFTEYLYNFLWWLSITNAMMVMLPLIGSIYENYDETLIAIKSAVFVVGVGNFMIKTIITRIHRERNQVIAMELQSFLNNADSNEEMILQRCLDNSWIFHTTMICSYYILSAFFLMSPLYLPQRLPSDAVYPFSTDPLWIYIVIYLQDTIVAFQISASLAIDCQAALYLWFVGARFEILVSEMKNVTDERKLRVCVEEHQKIVEYAELVIETFSGIAFTTITMTIVGMVLGSIVMISNQPAIIKILFTVLVFCVGTNIFICARAADNLIEASTTVMADGLYNLPWHSKSTDTRKIIQIMIQRTQQPITISLSGFVRALSHQYYASFISSAFSYFTTLRLMVQADD